MLDDLLARAIEQAEHSMAPVWAAALLRVARLETAVNPSAARNTLDRGLEAIRGLPGLDGGFLLEQAGLMAAVERRSYRAGRLAWRRQHLFEHTVLQVRLDHGHLKQAVSR